MIKIYMEKICKLQLKTKYKKLFKQLDSVLYLKAKNFDLLKKWRKQEKKLQLNKKKNYS